MQMILAIAAGGAVGAVLRHYLNSFAATLLGTGFPYGIFAANILGSFLMIRLHSRGIIDIIIQGQID